MGPLDNAYSAVWWQVMTATLSALWKDAAAVVVIVVVAFYVVDRMIKRAEED